MNERSALYDVVDGGVVLRVHAQPGAGRSGIVGRHGDALKVKVAAPPADGRANDAIAGVLAEAFGLKPAQLTLVSGPSSRAKRFRLDGVDAAAIDRRLHQLVAEPGHTPGAAALNRDRRHP